MSYTNVNGFIIIAADDRNADVSWQNHLERGSAGGVDCVAPLRTRLYAPMDCIVSSHWAGTGGRTIHMAEVDAGGNRTGWADEFMHADEAPVSGFVPAGGFVGYSGDSGGDYWPHVHWHRIDPSGRRRNPWHYFTSAPAGSDRDPIEEEDIMATIDEMRTVVRDVVREELSILQDRLRRESRLRLYRNVETGQMIALDPETGAKGVVIGPWDAIADPGKAVSLRANYALTADLPEQAQQLDNRQWGNLLRDLGITITA